MVIVKYDLDYQQFADIITKLPFHNLNFDKNFAKYCCKKLKKKFSLVFKKEQKYYYQQLSGINFFDVIQRKYILSNWKIDNLSPF